MRRVWWVLGGLALAVALLWLVGLRSWARHRLRVSEERWATTSGIADPLVRYPPVAQSDAARRLLELSARLGIKSPAPGIPNNVNAVYGWVSQQAEKTEDIPGPPPPGAVADFLGEHRADIEAIEALLLGQGPVVWERDMARGFEAPYPPLVVHRLLQGVILANALVAERTGHHEASQRALEASWRLEQDLRERPELISQLIVVVTSSLRQGVLRQASTPPREWRERLQDFDYRRTTRGVLRAEAWMFSRQLQGKGLGDVSSEEGQPPATGLRARLVRVATRPYVEMMGADYSERLEAAARELTTLDPCRLADDHDSRIRSAIPRWNVIGRIGMPSVARVWVTVGRAAFDAELTALVLEAKARRGQGAATALASRRSQACPSVRWVSTVEGGAVTIAPETDPFPASAPYPRAHRFTVGAQAALPREQPR